MWHLIPLEPFIYFRNNIISLILKEKDVSSAIKDRVQQVFQNLFDDTLLIIDSDTTADDIEEWDSLTHIDLIVAIEKEFKIKFSTAEVTGMKNVGDLLNLIERKTA